MSPRITFLCGLGVMAGLSAAVAAETVSFQNGVGGYESTLDLRINDDVLTLNQKGSSVQQYFIDGDQADTSQINYWGLIRFDSIFGTEPGQIPPGAFISSARLELTTSTVNDAQSGGPFGIARVLRPTDENSNWSTVFGADGVDLTDIERPVDGYRGVTAGNVFSADIAPIVQAWSNGAANHGLLLIAGTTDAWSVCTTGNQDPAKRPKLVVDFDPGISRTRAIAFQENVNGYAGTSMIFLRMDGLSDLGENYVREYLDMQNPNADPPDTTLTVHGLLKFDGLFGASAGQVPPSADILKAYLVITTAPRSESYQTRTNGPFNTRRLLSDFNWTLTDGAPGLRYWSDFGPDGPTEATGHIGPVISDAVGVIWDGQAWFEITDLVKAWQSGEPNLGLMLESASSDGWKINWLAEGAVPPQLVVLIPSRGSDLNGDTYVDQADVDIFAACAGGPEVPYALECAKADLDSDRDVDQDDFAELQRCFSGTGTAGAECL